MAGMAKIGDAVSPTQPGLFPAPQVFAQLDAILASAAFDATAQRRALLRYLVTETVEGRGDLLKGFTVAMAVFGRDASFDSQLDPIVRLEVRLLRRDLDSYYVSAGRRDPIRISIPKGHYAVRLDEQDVVREPPTPRQTDAPVTLPSSDVRRRVPQLPLFWAAAILGCAIALAMVWTFLGRSTDQVASLRRGPTLIVVPFEALNGTEEDRLLSTGIAQELIDSLLPFSEYRVYLADRGMRELPPEIAAIHGDLSASYLVRGSLRTENDSVRVMAQLVDANDGEVIWSEVFDRPISTKSLQEVQTNVATSIATALGEPYGEVIEAVSSEVKNYPTMESYSCILRANEYRSIYERTKRAPLMACLNAAVQRDPEYSDAWAMLGLLHMDGVRLGEVEPESIASEMKAALDATTKAVQLAPRNPHALQGLAAVKFALGAFDEAEKIQREAIALNPNDPMLLAQLGWRLAVRERFDEGLALLNEAIDRSVQPPGWYFNMIAIHAYMEGDLSAALEAAERSTSRNYGLGYSLVAIVQGALGNMDEAHHALREMEKAQPSLARDPAAAYRAYHTTDRITDSLVAGLEKAGLTELQAGQLP